jgi:dUTP pyrophosphatase
MKLLIKKLYPDVIAPSYGTDFAAGLDICAYGEYNVPKKSRKLISTGICIQWVAEKHDENPLEYYFRIGPRSGLSVKNWIDIGAGICDVDYRGEIKVCFINNNDVDYNISHGDRIAQGILERINRFGSIQVVDELEETKRGDCGFGSTGN